MKYYRKPNFIIKKNMQKSQATGVYFDSLLPRAILDKSLLLKYPLKK